MPTVAAVVALLLLIVEAAAQTMTVLPARCAVWAVPKGSTGSFTIDVGADTTTNFIVTGLSSAWLKASPTSGRTPSVVTFTIDTAKLKLDATYGVTISFVNLRNHKGDTTRAVVAMVVPPKAPNALRCDPPPTADNCVINYCLDEAGGILLAQ
jgi:hypothetical protein